MIQIVKCNEDETGWMYDKVSHYRARYYNPNTGRFLSEDPIGFAGGFNFYAYADDDPVDFNDPFGLDKNASNNAPTAPENLSIMTTALPGYIYLDTALTVS
jgi:RHS repeat-associated protein